MTKSRDAFRTISEVADWLETPAHVLRFWESKFTQVKPVKRAGGRRYYRPADMELLGGIKKLLHEDGMTIKGVQKILREQGVKHVSSLSIEIDSDLSGDYSDNETLIEDAPFIDVSPSDEENTVIAFVGAASDTDMTVDAEPAETETIDDVATAPVDTEAASEDLVEDDLPEPHAGLVADGLAEDQAGTDETDKEPRDEPDAEMAVSIEASATEDQVDPVADPDDQAEITEHALTPELLETASDPAPLEELEPAEFTPTDSVEAPVDEPPIEPESDIAADAGFEGAAPEGFEQPDAEAMTFDDDPLPMPVGEDHLEQVADEATGSLEAPTDAEDTDMVAAAPVEAEDNTATDAFDDRFDDDDDNDEEPEADGAEEVAEIPEAAAMPVAEAAQSSALPGFLTRSMAERTEDNAPEDSSPEDSAPVDNQILAEPQTGSIVQPLEPAPTSAEDASDQPEPQPGPLSRLAGIDRLSPQQADALTQIAEELRAHHKRLVEPVRTTPRTTA